MPGGPCNIPVARVGCSLALEPVAISFGPMGSFLRTILIWLAVIAIPTQGIAAAAMVHCGPGHASRSAKVPMPGHADHAAAQAREGEHPAGHHATVVVAGTAADGSESLRHGDLADTAQKSLSKCSACAASCCIAIGLLPVIATVSAVDAERTLGLVPVVPVRAFLTDGPERPPRSRLL